MHLSNKSKKIGLLISYCLLIINSMSSFILIPIYLKYLGVEGYGFYQMIYSVANYIMVLDFGISTTLIRFISEKKALSDETGKRNLIFHCFCIVCILSLLIFSLGLIIRRYLGNIYSNLSPEKIILGKQLLFYMIIIFMLTVFNHFIHGIILANEEFVISKSISLIKIISKVLLVIVFLNNGLGIISIALVDFTVISIDIALCLLYVIFILKEKMEYVYLDLKLLKNLMTFMFAIMLQSIVVYLMVTTNKMIVGMKLGEKSSGIYALSMTFITLFNMFPTAILSITLPKAMKITVKSNSMTEHNSLAVQIGRFQMLICCFFIYMFIICGNDFIYFWTNKKINSWIVWSMSLIVILPNAIPLIQNYCLNVLDALNKRLFRSIMLLIFAILNIFLTLLFIPKFQTFGPVLSMAIIYLFGHGLVMNIYYRRLGLDVMFIWKNILSKILVCVFAALIITLPLLYLQSKMILILIVKGCLCSFAYITIMYLWGLKDYEKQMIKDNLQKLKLKFSNA